MLFGQTHTTGGTMVESKTKYEASIEEINALFLRHGLGSVTNISPLGNGEFNAAYEVTCDDEKHYALKIAPPEGMKVLSYEENMMESEVFWYEMMHQNTDILCPKVYAVDFSREIIGCNCFIMQMMEGRPLTELNLSDDDLDSILRQKLSVLSKIHRIQGTGFGYRHRQQYSTWDEALKSMADSLISDCRALGYETPYGERFVGYIEKHADLLKTVPCRMVNFDLWDSNILYNDGKICLIDPERGFWGDTIGDFITLAPGQKSPLSEKKEALEIYNSFAEEKIVLSKETEIRYALTVCYLALIEEVEKYVRYEPDNPNYIRNTVDAKAMYEMAFEIL